MNVKDERVKINCLREKNVTKMFYVIIVWQKCHSERSEESISPHRRFFDKLRMTPPSKICQTTIMLVKVTKAEKQ